MIDRILYINYETTPSGATVHRDRLYESLKALGAEVTLLSRPSKGDGKKLEHGWGFDAMKRWLYLRHTDWALALMLGKNLPRELWAFVRIRPQALFLNFTIHLSSIPLARLFGVPVVLQVHSPPSLHCQYAGLRVRWSPFWKAVERLALALVDAVVVVSHTLKDYFVAQGVPEAKLHVVPNAVDLSRFHPDADPDRVTARYGLRGMIVLGYVGILDNWVRVDQLIRLVPRLSAAQQNLRLLIVGDGPLREEFQAAVRDLRVENQVIFTGFVPHEEIPEHIAAMDVALTPYRRVEVFYNSSMKLVEYMAMGRAIVAPRMGEIPDLIKDGENGLLYSPDNHDELEQKIFALLKSPTLRAALGLRAAQSITSRQWTWESNAREVLRAITAQIDRRRAIWLWP